jgi:hypothetical protein
MTVEANGNKPVERPATENHLDGAPGSASAVRAMSFGMRFAALSHKLPQRHFVPIGNLMSGVWEAGPAHPRAILRMVSSYC